MTDTNIFIFKGRLVKPAEVRLENSGKATLKFSVANNRSFKKADKWETQTSYFDVTQFGASPKLGEKLTKSTEVLVTARIDKKRVDDKTYWNVVAERVEILKAGDQSSAPVATDTEEIDFAKEEDDDDLPF